MLREEIPRAARDHGDLLPGTYEQRDAPASRGIDWDAGRGEGRTTTGVTDCQRSELHRRALQLAVRPGKAHVRAFVQG